MTCTRGCCESFAEHARSIAISAHATPNRKPRPVEIDATEDRWSRDHAAYRALRKNGYQPVRVDGAHRLEATATTEAQIEGRPEWS